MRRSRNGASQHSPGQRPGFMDSSPRRALKRRAMEPTVPSRRSGCQCGQDGNGGNFCPAPYRACGGKQICSPSPRPLAGLCKYPLAKLGALLCRALKGARRMRDPSPDLLRRPPSPRGRGKTFQRTEGGPERPPPSPRGEGGPRRALSPAGAGRVKGLFPG